jgi:signal transduction histidine kinase
MKWPGLTLRIVLASAGAAVVGAVVFAKGCVSTGIDITTDRLWLLLLPLSLAVALAITLVILPLLANLGRLKRAAARLGSPEYSPAGITSNDALRDLSVILDRTHERMVADAKTLAARQVSFDQRLSDVAHDLRTPLAALHISLEEAARSTTPQDAHPFMVAAIREAEALTTLIENLRLACRLEDRADPPEAKLPTDLVAAVQGVVVRLRPLARGRDVSVEVALPDGPVLVGCSEDRQWQVFMNLIQSAVLRGEPHGHVAVVVDRDGPDRFRVIVVDDGPGRPPATIPALVGNAGGPGPRAKDLALAVTSEICDRCGWTLSFAVETHRGIRVTLAGPTVAAAG